MKAVRIDFEMGGAGLKVSARMPLRLLDGHRAWKAESQAGEAAPASDRLAEDLAAAVAEAIRIIPQAAEARAVAVELEGRPFDLSGFSVAFSDRLPEEVMATDYRTATAVAAVRAAAMGQTARHLASGLGLAPAIAERLDAIDSGPRLDGVHARFSLADWRVLEKSDDELTELQRAPMQFELRAGAYGPTAVFARDGKEYCVALEIDHGCVVARGYPANDDDSWAAVRLADGRYQVDLVSGNDCLTFDGHDGVREAPKDAKLVQDGPEEVSPAI